LAKNFAWTRPEGKVTEVVRHEDEAPADEAGEFRSTIHPETMKRRIVHVLQKYLFNPPVRLLFDIGLARPGYALLETIGRKSGKPRRTPVGDGRVRGQFWIVAEQGMKAGYVLNIAHNPRVRLKIREGLRSRWHTGTAHLLPEDDPRERQRWLAIEKPGSAGNAKLVRFFGTQLLTVRIDLDS
jgi:deazaflavin-dependent oxidoreductase (nitroreductase family)